jgi:hypothetical protein
MIPIKHVTGAVAVALLLAGCDRGSAGLADHLILCEPRTKKAFHVSPRDYGRSSLILPAPQLDAFCRIELDK